MTSIPNPNLWTAPYDYSYADCSEGVCNIYCPQWCYINLPPPPPPFFFNSSSSSSYSSPLLAAVIGILATALLLIIYYTLISKYCNYHSQTSYERHYRDDHVSFFFSSNAASKDGLNDSVIKSIPVLKYSKGDGVVDGSDCSVCLSEFQENESLRLLPKCNHAFHLPCIDTWLKSHSTCPLCRAFVTGTALTTTTSETVNNQPQSAGETVVVIADLEMGSQPPPEEQGARLDPIRRSVSLNSGTVVVVSIADVMRETEEDERDGESSNVKFIFSSKKLPN